jgi:hypothetical protein
LRLKEVLLGQKEKTGIEEKAVLVDSSFTFIEENMKTEVPIEKEKELETKPKQSRIFDNENLYWARQKLQEIISLTGAIKEKHHWV